MNSFGPIPAQSSGQSQPGWPHAFGAAQARPIVVTMPGTSAAARAPVAHRRPPCHAVFIGGTSGLKGTRRARCWVGISPKQCRDGEAAEAVWGGGVPRQWRVSMAVAVGGGSYSSRGRRSGLGAVQPRMRRRRGRSSLKGVVGGGASRDSGAERDLRQLCLDRRRWEDLGVVGCDEGRKVWRW
jgi:hypothetical protein